MYCFIVIQLTMLEVRDRRLEIQPHPSCTSYIIPISISENKAIIWAFWEQKNGLFQIIHPCPNAYLGQPYSTEIVTECIVLR